MLDKIFKSMFQVGERGLLVADRQKKRPTLTPWSAGLFDMFRSRYLLFLSLTPRENETY